MMMAGGEWTRKRPSWWQYRLPGHERPFADVIQQRGDGPNGEVWDALSAAGIGMTPLVEGVSLEKAKAAVEQHATQQDG